MFLVCEINKKKKVYDLPRSEFEKGEWCSKFSSDSTLLDISYNLESQKITVTTRDIHTVKEEIKNGNATNTATAGKA